MQNLFKGLQTTFMSSARASSITQKQAMLRTMTAARCQQSLMGMAHRRHFTLIDP